MSPRRRAYSVWTYVLSIGQTVLGNPVNRTLNVTTYPEFVPQGLSIGAVLSTETSSFDLGTFTLNSTHPIATLDYGLERAGYPFFSISNVNTAQAVQIEVKYSESFVGLEQPWSDGPYTFANGLSNSFRVETFNISATGLAVGPLLQGGQRWQSIRLLTEGGSVSFDGVGLKATVDEFEPGEFPGAFSCDDDELNAIWNLGAVAAATACVEKGTQKAIWEVDPVMGVYVRSTRPSQTLVGATFANYTLSFDTYIDRGGVWWSVAWPFGLPGGIQLLLVGELPEDSTFINTNKTLTRPSSILLSYGYGFVNQTTLMSYNLDRFDVPFAVTEKTWHHISTAISPNGFLSVSLRDKQIFNVSMSDYNVEHNTAYFSGSFGFGAWQDQAAYIRNVSVTDTANGSTIYTNPMTSPDVLAEYGTQANLASVCLDGPKRDRLVWLGDFYHTARIIGASTSRHDLSRATLQFLLDTQLANGQLSISPPMGYNPEVTAPWAPDDAYALGDYQLLGISAFYNYVRQTNDLEFAQQTWSRWQRLTSWLIGNVNATDELVHFSNALVALGAFLGPADAGSAVSCLAVQVLREMAEIAQALGDQCSEMNYTAVADSLEEAINTQLWNDDLGVYSTSLDNKTDFSVAGIAFCITSGVATSERSTRSIAALQRLALGPGYKDSTAASPDDPSVVISPNTNGLLLDALFKSNASFVGHSLIKSLWGAMINSSDTTSGASWEYVAQNGEPGLGLFTSLAHPWGGAATYVLSEWAAGIQPVSGPEGFGYASWVVSPDAGVQMGLERAAARVVSAFGALSVSWTIMSDDVLQVRIEAPPETYGTFRFRGQEKPLAGASVYSFTAELET